MPGVTTLQLLWANNKIIIIIFLTLILVIPIGTYVISWRSKASNEQLSQNAYDRTVTLDSNSLEKTGSSNAIKSELEKLTDEIKKDEQKQGTKEASSSFKLPNEGAEVSFGPTLDFTVSFEGRPEGRMAAKTFVGLAAGNPVDSPQYLLSFNVEVPDSGTYSGLSLAGLDQGKNYTAYLKGPSQIATASAFIVGTSSTKLNGGNALNLITGDLNEDNVINSADISILKAAYGATPSSSKWNANLDFNLDNIINSYDLAIITKNLGKTGSSGSWYSKSPISTASASLKQPASIGAPLNSTPSTPQIIPAEGGHWVWIPRN